MLMAPTRSRLATTLALAAALLACGLALVIYGLVARRSEPVAVTPATPRATAVATAQPTAAATAAQPTAAATAVEGAPLALSAASFRYIGKWHIVRNMNDGRYAGMSGRSYVPGDRAVITFAGHAIRLYGVDGPGGGTGSVKLDGALADPDVSFLAPVKKTHVLVFASATLPEGKHQLTITVNRPSPHDHHAYVNVESAAYDP